MYQQRKAVAKKFGTIWHISIARRYYNVLSGLGRESVKLLEVGAGDQSLQAKMASYWGTYSYKSCDIDTQYEHDFKGIDEVKGEYELICAFEMIEHVSLEEAHHLPSRCYEHTVEGGQIAITTPNIYYPPDFLRDATHRAAFCYDELGGLLQLCGYEVTALYRLYHDSIFKKFVKRILMYPIFRVLGIDFSHQIMVVGKKPG
ncbi:MAG: methyltransferase domain-containing protein [Pseudomonadales bacterium]